MAIAILEASTFANIPSYVPFGVLYFTQDTLDLYIGTGAANGPAVSFIAGGGGSGGGLSGVNSQTSSYLAVNGDNGKLLAMNGANLTLTLPATPPSATWGVFVENLNATPLTLFPNGLTLDTVASSLSMLPNTGLYVTTDGANYFTERGLATQAPTVATSDNSNNIATTAFVNNYTATLLAPQLPALSSLLAQYNCLDGSGSNLSDSSGNGNNGTLGPTTHAPTWIAASAGGGLKFAAASQQYVSLPAAVNGAKTFLLVTFFDPAAANNEYGSPLSPNAGNTGPNIMYTWANSVLSGAGNQNYMAGSWNGALQNGTNPKNIHGYQILTYSEQAGGDQFYQYTVPNGQGGAIGTLSSGNYQLGGGAGAGATTWFQGQILFAAFWSVALTTAQVTQAVQAVQQLFINRGLPLNGTPAGGTWQTPDYNDTFCLDGDSETTYILAANLPTVPTTPSLQIYNTGQSGQTAEAINANSTYAVDSNLPNLGSAVNGGTAGQGANRAGVITFIGTNDSGGSATTPLGSLASYCRTRRKAGWNKIGIVTMMSRSGVDSFKNSYDALLRQYWADWSDLLLDVAANPNWGANGASANTAYMAAGLHWTSATTLQNVSGQMSGWFYSYAMRRLYGNPITGVPNVASASPYLCQPEDIFWIANSAGAISAYLIPAQMFTGQTVTVRNVGAGTLTLNPKSTTATITNFAITGGNLVTVTAANNFTAGDVVVLSGLTTNPTLNGLSGIINATNLSASSFQFAFTHANITSGAETGSATLGNMCQMGLVTNVAESAGNVVTLTVSNNFANGSSIKISGVGAATWLNGQTVTLTSANSTTITFTDGSSHGTYASTADTGVCVYNYPAETINGNASITVASGATCVLLSQIAASSTGMANWISLQNS